MHIFDFKKIAHIRSNGFKWNHKSFRFILELETTANGSSVAIVIMKNPAFACKYHLCYNNVLNAKTTIESDATVNHIIQNLYPKYKRIIILNLYPFMSSDTNVVRKFYYCNKMQSIRNYTERRNKSIIFSVLRTNKDAKIFCAWGQESHLNSTLYAKTIYEFISKCNKRHYILGEFDSSKKCWIPLTSFIPTHGSKW